METLELVEGKVNWKGKTAVKNVHGGIRAASFVLVVFGFENLANLHMAVNLVTYFNGVLHMEQSDAANALTNFMGTGYILSILFAIFADTLIGRFRTVLIAGSIEFLGLILLTVQAHYSSLKPPPCNVFDPTSHCEKLKSSHAVFLYVALYLVAAGMGGIKAGVPSHGADQFDERDPREAKQMSSFFNGLLFVLCIGGAVSLTLFVWLDDHKGWYVGFGSSSIAMFLALVFAVLGWPLYRIHVVQGTSAIVEIIQVFVAAIRNRNLQLPENPLELYEIDKDKEAAWEDELLPHRDIYRFLDKAAIQTTSQTPSPWKLCTVTQVERVGLILSSISMATASIMEVKRKSVARDHNMVDALPVLQPLPISVFWLSFQYFIFGIADMFTYVGLLEFFYSEAPKKIKTVSTCFLWTSMSLGYFLSTIMVQIVNRATKDNTRSGGWLAGNNINKNHLNLFYLLLSLMSLVNFIIYLTVSRFYKYRSENKDERQIEAISSS
ncbi:hypothetical protein V6N12_008839 [Hibiscus sabdariffa]|uniref:Uncharacterized protein n=1 Tax=Hibiscus sabdariffa TaxID=183260 RepID=A0ABR2C4N4_9ROSI